MPTHCMYPPQVQSCQPDWYVRNAAQPLSVYATYPMYLIHFAVPPIGELLEVQLIYQVIPTSLDIRLNDITPKTIYIRGIKLLCAKRTKMEARRGCTNLCGDPVHLRKVHRNPRALSSFHLTSRRIYRARQSWGYPMAIKLQHHPRQRRRCQHNCRKRYPSLGERQDS